MFYFYLHHQFNLVRNQFWHQVISDFSDFSRWKIVANHKTRGIWYSIIDLCVVGHKLWGNWMRSIYERNYVICITFLCTKVPHLYSAFLYVWFSKHVESIEKNQEVTRIRKFIIFSFEKWCWNNIFLMKDSIYNSFVMSWRFLSRH
jgi:hypothetical protein